MPSSTRALRSPTKRSGTKSQERISGSRPERWCRLSTCGCIPETDPFRGLVTGITGICDLGDSVRSPRGRYSIKSRPGSPCYAVLRSLLECSGWLHFKLSGAIESARVGSGAGTNCPVTEVGGSMSSKNWCSKATRQVGCDRLRSKSSPVVAPWLEGFCVTPARARNRTIIRLPTLVDYLVSPLTT